MTTGSYYFLFVASLFFLTLDRVTGFRLEVNNREPVCIIEDLPKNEVVV